MKQRNSVQHESSSMQISPGNADQFRIGLRSLLLAGAVLFALMMLTGIISRSIPPGSYQRTEQNGLSAVVPGTYQETSQPPLPFWRWLTAPAEVLWGPDNVMIISIIAFMCLIAGSISVMYSGGILSFSVKEIIRRFRYRRYVMQAMTILLFMLFGSLLGSFEEIIVLVPLMVTIAVSLGWDRITGLGLSLGAIGVGFSAALTNPFTIGAAQKLAGLPVFSGFFYRLIIFVCVYAVYTVYVVKRSKHIEMPELHPDDSSGSSGNAGPADGADSADDADGADLLPAAEARKKRAGLLWFAAWMFIMAAAAASSAGIQALSDFILPAVVSCFIIGGIGSARIAGLPWKNLGKTFLEGFAGVLPGAILILMAASIKHILSASGSMDTVLYTVSQRIESFGPIGAALALFLLVLVLNFFISSGSAKAFLIMPIVSPLADTVGLSRQTAVLAYMFGDGFSNIIYPTNALLLICLAISGVSYFRWLAWIWKIEAVLLAISVLFIIIAVLIGYA